MATAVKVPFDVTLALERIEDAIREYPKAALFELAEEGYRSLFEQLVACIVSIRTRDEQTIRIARRLFARARTPRAIAALSPAEIERLIHPTTFHYPKARQIHAIAERAVEIGGKLPCDAELLRSFAGVGPKCANLALSIACGEPRIAVDVHVHRVTNRWGYVHERTPEATMAALEAKLPREHWITINRLLVPFGKHVCTGARPLCSTCPVLAMCQQVGVTSHR
ncbi:MAG TPA: endonuclease III [Chloroflexota bacterium]|nr:endonuclease III [Chloroflexota bacterium]